MRPVAFTLELFGQPVTFYAYGLCLAAGSVVGGLVALRAASRIGIDFGRIIAALAVVALGGGLGGWLFQSMVSLIDGAAVHDLFPGGRAVIGSIVGGGLALAIAGRFGLVPFPRFADAAIVAAPLAQALGRIGCFFAGCCYGAESHGPLAVTATDPLAPEVLHVARHPWPLYESAADLAIAAALLFWPAVWPGARPGARTAAYLGLYAAARIALETLRGDPDRGVYFDGHLSASQVACGAILVTVIGLAWRARTLAGAPPSGYSGPSEERLE